MFNLWMQVRTHVLVLAGLVLLAVLAYGKLVWMGGVFGDDPSTLWDYQRLGNAGFDAFYGWARPYSTWMHKLVFLFTGFNIRWVQTITLSMRVCSCFMLYVFIRELTTPKSPIPWMAACIALLFPGFAQQAHAVQYLLHFSVLCLVLFSLWALVRAASAETAFTRWAWIALSLVSACAQISIEYFIGLELLRPVVALIAIRQKSGKQELLRKWAAMYWPFLLLLAGYLVWRVILFQPAYPRIIILDTLKNNPLSALPDLLRRIGTDLWKVIGKAWLWMGQSLVDKKITPLMIIFGVLGGAIACILLVLNGKYSSSEGKKRWVLLALGLAGILTGGLPLWASGTPLTVAHPWNRTMLCYLVGVSMWLAALLSLLPKNFGRILFAIVIGLSIIFQMQVSHDYEREWTMVQSLFNQLIQEAPNLREGTLVLYDDFPFHFYSANNLNALLNWTYDPQRGDGPEKYKMFEIDERLGNALPSLNVGETVLHNTYHGSTSLVLVIVLEDNGNLVILDRDKPYFGILPGRTREAEHLSSPQETILLEHGTAVLPDILQQH